jgi:DNA polymerase III alpha subunit
MGEKFVQGATKHFSTWPGPHVYEGDKLVQLPPPDEEAREKAEELWDELCEFASYAFNLAHAVEYCMISFMTAWLKVNHPLEFAVAQLRNAADDDQAKNLLRELA